MTLDLAQILERWKETKECPSSILIQKLQECADDVPALVAKIRELEEKKDKPLLVLEM
jgi:hypothetical protein